MKILIFYGSYGGGHLSAARSINENILATYPNCETTLVDCIEYINKRFNKISTKFYSEVSKSVPKLWGTLYTRSGKGSLSRITTIANRVMSVKLNKIIKEYNPDLIISTHPFSSSMCASLKKHNKINCKIATVLTDYAPHNQWLIKHEYVNYYFVAHNGMTDFLTNKGIPKEKIYATGIPLSNKFLQNYNKEEILNFFELKQNKKIVLFFAGGEFGLGKGKTYSILKSLIEDFKDIQIIAISGKNEKAKAHFDDLVKLNSKEEDVKVLKYTDKVPELMSISDLVITKPGGLTTTESLASGLPIIVINPIPGQEEENAEFLEKNNVAVWIKSKDDVRLTLNNLFSNPSELTKMKINARLLAKKNSTKDICKILIEN